LARKTGQIVGRGPRRWLVRIFLGCDRETRRRRYLSRTVHGPVRQAQSYLNKVLRERDLGRQVEGVTVTLNEFLDRWLDTAAKPKLREKSCQSCESLLRRYVRPVLGERILSAITPLDVQDPAYHPCWANQLRIFDWIDERRIEMVAEGRPHWVPSMNDFEQAERDCWDDLVKP